MLPNYVNESQAFLIPFGIRQKPKKGDTTWNNVKLWKEKDRKRPCGRACHVLPQRSGIGNTLKHRWQYYSLDNNRSSPCRLLYLFSKTYKQVAFRAAQRRISVVADHIMKRNTPGPHPPTPLAHIPPLFDLMTHHLPHHKYPQMQFLSGKTCIYVFYLYIYLLSPGFCLYQALFFLGTDSGPCHDSNNFRQ